MKSATGLTRRLFRSIDFGREHHQRPVDAVERVPAQQVEVVRRVGRHGDGHRALGAQLQEPFDAAGGVVGALAFVAVREQQHHAGLCWPHLASPEERYSSMTDWAPLTKSPNWASHSTNASRLADGVAVLEAERRVLRERRVVDQDPFLVVGQVLQRHVLGRR